MDTKFLAKLREQSDLLAEKTPLDHQRFLIEDITWSWRCNGIRGARGVGKTTLLLQRMRLSPEFSRSVYLSLDDFHFKNFTLRDTVEAFRRIGVTHFYLDEVHKYDDWSREIKNLYDFFPDISLHFTGSSIVELNRQEVDLSRRAIMYDLPGLSFREYLKLTKVLDFKPVTLENLLAGHREIAASVAKEIRPNEHFKKYLREGYYPFFLEDPALTFVRIRQVVNLVLSLDLSTAEGGRIAKTQKIGRLLQLVADSAPFKPNLANISRAIEIDRDTIARYLEHLHRAQLISMLFSEPQSFGGLQRPEKIYLNNTNLCHALTAAQPDEGNLRETFFQNQVSVKYAVSYPVAGDFLVNARHTFEVGGRGKTKRQIADLQDSYLVLDDVEIGSERQIPLWLFGFLY